MHIGAAIKQLRKKASIAQGELAAMCGISATTLSQIEAGIKKPSRRTLKKVCEALDIPEFVVYLLALEQTDVSPENIGAYNVVFPVLQGLLLQIVMPAGHFQLETAVA